MLKFLLALALAAGLACAPARLPVSGTGTPGAAVMQLHIDNRAWSMAKVYVVPAGSSTGRRIASVDGLSEGVVRPMVHAPRFRLRVEFLAGSTVWQSEVWNGTVKCLVLVINEYVDSSYVFQC